MRSRLLETQYVGENLKLEVIYESNPCFAGESIQALIRLRHLGSQQAKNQLEAEKQVLEQELEKGAQDAANGGKRGLMQTLLGSINKEQKALEEKARKRHARLEHELGFHSPVSLASCYVQLSGVFQYNPETLDRNKMTKDNSKIAGVGSLKISTGKHAATEGLAGILFANLEDVARESMAEKSPQLEKIPLLLVPQTLIFSEIMLEPGEVRTFQFKSPRLPQEQPPTYKSSKNLKIQYYLSFGLTKIEADKISPFNTDFQVHLCPYIDAKGRQSTSKLDTALTILAPGRVKEIKDNQKSRKKSISSGTQRRRSSLQSLVSTEVPNEGNPACKDLFKKLVEDHFSSNELTSDIEGLVDQLMTCQFGTGNYGSSEEEEVEKDPSKLRRDVTSVHDNLIRLNNNLSDVICAEGKDYEAANPSTNLLPQFRNLQQEYIINRNGAFVAKVHMAKAYFTTSDDIDLTIDLATEGEFKVSAVTTSLKSFEIINPLYAFDTSPSSTKQQGQTVDETRAISFEETCKFRVKLA